MYCSVFFISDYDYMHGLGLTRQRIDETAHATRSSIAQPEWTCNRCNIRRPSKRQGTPITQQKTNKIPSGHHPIFIYV